MSSSSYEDPHICNIPYEKFASHQFKKRFWGLQQGHVCLSSFYSLWNWISWKNCTRAAKEIARWTSRYGNISVVPSLALAPREISATAMVLYFHGMEIVGQCAGGTGDCMHRRFPRCIWMLIFWETERQSHMIFSIVRMPSITSQAVLLWQNIVSVFTKWKH